MSNEFLNRWSPFLAAIVPILVLFAAVELERRRRRLTEKPPQEEKLLRPPGHTLSLKLDEITEALLTDAPWAYGLCGLAGVSATCAASLFAAQAPILWISTTTFLFVFLALAGVRVVLRMRCRVNEAWNLRLGLRGEQAVAEALHEAGDAGFRAFHDLPAGENWNIDHVVVGSRGVFLIETKARRRRVSPNGQPKHVVVYDGKALQFPAGADLRAIPQAQRNARWLADFLGKKTGEPVTVEPVVAVPGWYVEARGAYPVKVMNASYLTKYLRGQNEKLAGPQVRRIVTALDEKCRDLEF